MAYSIKFTNEEEEKLSRIARKLGIKRAQVLRRLIAVAEVQEQTAPNVASQIVAETREEYK